MGTLRTVLIDQCTITHTQRIVTSRVKMNVKHNDIANGFIITNIIFRCLCRSQINRTVARSPYPIIVQPYSARNNSRPLAIFRASTSFDQPFIGLFGHMAGPNDTML